MKHVHKQLPARHQLVVGILSSTQRASRPEVDEEAGDSGAGFSGRRTADRARAEQQGPRAAVVDEGRSSGAGEQRRLGAGGEARACALRALEAGVQEEDVRRHGTAELGRGCSTEDGKGGGRGSWRRSLGRRRATAGGGARDRAREGTGKRRLVWAASGDGEARSGAAGGGQGEAREARPERGRRRAGSRGSSSWRRVRGGCVLVCCVCVARVSVGWAPAGPVWPGSPKTIFFKFNYREKKKVALIK